MKVYILQQESRLVVAFVSGQGIFYLPSGSELPRIPQKKKIEAPLFMADEIRESLPGLVQAAEEYASVAVAAKKAEDTFADIRSYLLRKVFAIVTFSSLPRKKRGWEFDMATNFLNEGVKRIRVYTGQDEEALIVSVVKGRKSPESARAGGKRVMFIAASPVKARTVVRTSPSEWGLMISDTAGKRRTTAGKRRTSKQKEEEEIEYCVYCPQSFAEGYIDAHTHFSQLDERRSLLGRAIAGAYGDQGNLAIEIQSPHGWLVLYDMPATVSSAYTTPPHFMVTIAGRRGGNAGNAGDAAVTEEGE